jgi:hypothetical protein
LDQPARPGKKTISIVLLVIGILIVLGFLIYKSTNKPSSSIFNAQRAYQDVLVQTGFGPRLPNTEAHEKTVDYIQEQLTAAGWQVELQNSENLAHPMTNIIARRGTGAQWVILGAHYDSRLLADHDPDPMLQSQPVPGANDGASGVAVLLELARILPRQLNQEVWLVFFDLEDQGRIEGYDWILGSQFFVDQLNEKPDAVIVIDMIGDEDLQIYKEKSSTQALVNEIWQVAKDLSYEEIFSDEEKYSILDDHTPFLNAGIQAIDIIDFDYPYWHTTADTADKVSAESLEIIGNLLFAWLNP